MAIVTELLATGAVDAADLARVTHVSAENVRRWQRSNVTPARERQQRLVELKAVLDLSVRAIGADNSGAWLRHPVPSLDHKTPLDVVAGGNWRRVTDLLTAFAEGVTA